MDVTTLTFPFVEELPRREKSRWQKIREAYEGMKAIQAEKGMLIPATLAAKLCDISRQRMWDLMEQGKVERVEVDGHVFITESSLMHWLNTDLPVGRPRKSVKQVWDDCHQWAKESVQSRRKK